MELLLAIALMLLCPLVMGAMMLLGMRSMRSRREDA
jgi:hypothetical protein